jgi:hypothetical protein
MLPSVLVEETRHEIDVTVQLNGRPAIPLRLVVFASNEGDAILTAHGQIEALAGRNRCLRSIRFASPDLAKKKGGAS